MIKRYNYQICLQCFGNLKWDGIGVTYLLENILEAFCILNEPVAVRGAQKIELLRHLERKKCILTTEFPDPENEKIDIVLAIPLGGSKLKEDYWHFCFDRKGHKHE